jgi:hypothetical protein
MSVPTVTKTLYFNNHAEASAKLQMLAARFVKSDPDTGLRLYKTAAGLVLRERTAVQYEVLANCAC